MTIGLDLGSFQFRSMRIVDGQLVARCCPAVFATMADTTSHRRLLQQSNTQFATCSGQLLVFGEDAREWSEMLNLTPSPLLRGGRIPASDPVSRQVLTLIVDALLPAQAEQNSVCKMTLPGGGFDDKADHRDAEFFLQLVTLRGYRPEFITATHAVALSELPDAAFTGMTVTLGHTTCEFGITHSGREIVRCVVMSGLDSFDGSPRLGTGEVVQEPMATTSSVDRDYFRFFVDVVTEARMQFEREGTLKTLPRMMPVVCAGGITATPSFLPLFQAAWNEASWPIETAPVRLASNASLSVARGCLVQAELEQPSEAKAA